MLLFDPMLSLEVHHVFVWPEFLSLIAHPLGGSGTFFAQFVEKVDVIGDMQKGFKHFIDSGQVWALGIGFVMGYLFRNFTAY